MSNTLYERLNQMEKIQLFNDYFEASNIVKVKTRSEVLYATCYEQYNSARNLLKLNAVQQYWHVRV